LLGLSAAIYAADEAMQIPVNTGNTQAGDGHAVMFKGSPLPLTDAYALNAATGKIDWDAATDGAVSPHLR
jgi:hypothetical protein